MLNVDQFYGHYGQVCAPDEFISVGEKQVLARGDRLYVFCKESVSEPFVWLSRPFDGLVFRTHSGYLAALAIFDSEMDETLKAVQLCNQLAGLVQ